jgi:hypothetical protein
MQSLAKFRVAKTKFVPHSLIGFAQSGPGLFDLLADFGMHESQSVDQATI